MSKYTSRPEKDKEVCVHAMSRVVQKRFLIDEKGMEAMRRILRTQADFAGLEVITFCFLKNHFHLLLYIDPDRAREEVDDVELVRRFTALYGTRRSPSLGVDAEALAIELATGGIRAHEIRQRLRARMGDVSVFMRELKTRFTFWYNQTYETVGTFWAERFRSVLLEPSSAELRVVAAYVDLNAVRAGQAISPKTYPFCGLGEACCGRWASRRAYRWLERRRGRRASQERPLEQVFGDYLAFVESLLEQARLWPKGQRPAPGDGGSASGVRVEEAQGAYTKSDAQTDDSFWKEIFTPLSGLDQIVRVDKEPMPH